MVNVELFESDTIHTTLHLDPATLTVAVTEVLDGGIIRQRSLGRFAFAEAFWLFRGDAELFGLGEIPAVIRELNKRGYTAASWNAGRFREEIFGKFLTARKNGSTFAA